MALLRPSFSVGGVGCFQASVGKFGSLLGFRFFRLEALAAKKTHAKQSLRIHVWYIYIYIPTFGFGVFVWKFWLQK